MAEEPIKHYACIDYDQFVSMHTTFDDLQDWIRKNTDTGDLYSAYANYIAIFDTPEDLVIFKLRWL